MLLLLALQLDLIHEDPLGGADSSISPDGSVIAFSSRREGSLDLWLVDVKTRETRRLTSDPANEYEPRFSPDGGTIVFVGDRHGSQDLFLVDAAGGEETRLTDTKLNEDYPSFSPDGRRIVYTGGPWSGREVHILDVESRTSTQITRNHKLVGAASFSPDGEQLVYHVYHESYESGESDLWSVAAAGGEPVRVTDDKIWDYKPTWSPDGARIAFSSKRDTACFNIWTCAAAGGDFKRVTGFEGEEARWPNWTSDGRIAFHAIRPHRGSLRGVDPESGEIRDLATFEGRIARLAPSPDGSRVAYELDNAIWIHDGEPRQLTRGTHPQWSPDGKRIAFLRNRTAAIYVIDADGGRATRLEGDKPVWPEPAAGAWSPDGRWLAAVIDGQIAVTGTEERRAKRLTEGEGVREFPAWVGGRVVFAEYHPQRVRYYVTTP